MKKIDGDPVVVVTRVNDANLFDLSGSLDSVIDEIGSRRWRATISEPSSTGYFNIFAFGDDLEGNSGSLGVNPFDGNGLTDFFGQIAISDDAIFFEGDIDTPSPRITSDGLELEVDEVVFLIEDPFVIQLNFDETADGEARNEGNEYVLDNFGDAFIDIMTLDGVDVTGLTSTADNREYQLTIPAIAPGLHELIVIASDKAGSQSLTQVEFEIVTGVEPQPVNKFLAGLSGVLPGPHTIRLNAVDEAGNQLVDDFVVSFNVASTADLQLTMVDSPDPAIVGGLLNYVLTVTNNGPFLATNIVLTDTLPAGVEFIAAKPAESCSILGAVVTCNVIELDATQSAVLMIDVLLSGEAGDITNTATVESDSPDPDESNNTASETTSVRSFDEAGDCNGDGVVSSADMTAAVLEIFDGDGDDPANADSGTFAGTTGCDANEDGTISAADITCVVLIIFNGPGTCGPLLTFQ